MAGPWWEVWGSEGVGRRVAEGWGRERGFLKKTLENENQQVIQEIAEGGETRAAEVHAIAILRRP